MAKEENSAEDFRKIGALVRTDDRHGPEGAGIVARMTLDQKLDRIATALWDLHQTPVFEIPAHIHYSEDYKNCGSLWSLVRQVLEAKLAEHDLLGR